MYNRGVVLLHLIIILFFLSIFVFISTKAFFSDQDVEKRAVIKQGMSDLSQYIVENADSKCFVADNFISVDILIAKKCFDLDKLDNIPYKKEIFFNQGYKYFTAGHGVFATKSSSDKVLCAKLPDVYGESRQKIADHTNRSVKALEVNGILLNYCINLPK